MRFTIPQFIEHEAKIIGPLTLKQFMYLGFAGAICFVLYFIASKAIFFLSLFVLGGLGAALAFVKINNIPLPNFIFNFIKFKVSPKMYLWEKETEQKIVLKERIAVKKEEVPEDELPLKIAGKSQLKNIKTRIEAAKGSDEGIGFQPPEQ
jgi:hypothetical protein